MYAPASRFRVTMMQYSIFIYHRINNILKIKIDWQWKLINAVIKYLHIL